MSGEWDDEGRYIGSDPLGGCTGILVALSLIGCAVLGVLIVVLAR